MDRLKIYHREDIKPLLTLRDGEVRLGERIQFVDQLDDIRQSDAQFVLLGIPEDIGVRANFGVGGTQTAWLPALRAFLNLQSNSFLSGSEILLLGAFEIEEPKNQSIAGLRKKVAEIDTLVFPVIEKIVSSGKIPLVVGGGHNNAYGIIKGCARAVQKPINVINIDAHADLRQLEGRHSGNGFSYALQEGLLSAYAIFGLAESYTHPNVIASVSDSDTVKAIYLEELLRSSEPLVDTWSAFSGARPDPCGLELDLDSIQGVLSSAVSPSGFQLNEVRSLLLNSEKKFCYLHICEGAVQLVDGRQDAGTAKTIAFLISDFIKALLPHTARQPSA